MTDKTDNRSREAGEREAFEQLCALLPAHTNWSDPITPDIVRHIVSASQPKSLTDAQLDAAILEWFSYERDQDDFRARMRAAIIAATKEQL
jgi:hypothetical protein